MRKTLRSGSIESARRALPEAAAAFLPNETVPVGAAKRNRARHDRRDTDRSPSERVSRPRGVGPGIDAPVDSAVFASSPRDRPARGRSAATPASHDLRKTYMGMREGEIGIERERPIQFVNALFGAIGEDEDD